MLDQLQKNYSAKFQQHQNMYKLTALQYNDSIANLSQQITQSKYRISKLVENAVQNVVQEQSILRYFNLSELNETLIKVKRLESKFNDLIF